MAKKKPAKEMKPEKATKVAEKKTGKKIKIKGEKKAKAPSVHFDEIKRLNRVSGQLEGISKMLESNRKLHDVLTQFKAVHSALDAIEHRLFDIYVTTSVEDIISAEKRKEREGKLDELKKLYKAV
jgi:DNA-binding FrmR family transcriptional regulator